MARVHYCGDVPFTVERGPHRGWTWYYFETGGRSYKLLTQCAAEKGYSVDDACDQSTIYANDGMREHREPPWPSYHSVSLKTMLTVEDAIKIVRLVFATYSSGMEAGKVEAQRTIRKSLGI